MTMYGSQTILESSQAPPPNNCLRSVHCHYRSLYLIYYYYSTLTNGRIVIFVNEIDLDSLAVVPSNSQPSYDRPWYLTSIVFMSWWKRSACSSLKFNFLYSFTVGIFATNIAKSIRMI
jgi:hypothetical protein